VNFPPLDRFSRIGHSGNNECVSGPRSGTLRGFRFSGPSSRSRIEGVGYEWREAIQ
jgi:hypothetical protein